MEPDLIPQPVIPQPVIPWAREVAADPEEEEFDPKREDGEIKKIFPAMKIMKQLSLTIIRMCHVYHISQNYEFFKIYFHFWKYSIFILSTPPLNLLWP